MSFLFYLNAFSLGIALAMDAFSVSIANAIAEPAMKKSKKICIAGTFGLYQAVMPLIGWYCVHTAAAKFTAFQKAIPWIALILLTFIGGKMLAEAFRRDSGQRSRDPEALPDEDENNSCEIKKAVENTPAAPAALTLSALLLQGLATSIDALSVGFIIADYAFGFALLEALIIGVTTFFISLGGLQIGSKIGERFSDKASALGGIILIGIGLEIFIRSFL